MSRPGFHALLLIAGLAAASLAAAGDAGKMPADLVRFLEAAKPSDAVELIVQFKEGPSDSDHLRVKKLGGKHLRTLSVINAAVYRLPASKVRSLASEPTVVRVSPNRGISAPKPVAPDVLANGDLD